MDSLVDGKRHWYKIYMLFYLPLSVSANRLQSKILYELFSESWRKNKFLFNRHPTFSAVDHFAGCMKLEIKQITIFFTNDTFSDGYKSRGRMKWGIRWNDCSGSKACCTVLKMSIIDPRKEMKSNDYKNFFLDFLFCNTLDCFPPSQIYNIHHIQLLRLFNQKSPFSLLLWKKISKKSDCPHTILSEKKMPNHHLGCGHVDAWSRVMLLQFPSGRFFFLSSLFSFFSVPFLFSWRGKLCTLWTFSRHFFFSCVQSFRPFAFSIRLRMCFSAVLWTREKSSGIMV